MVFVVLKFVSIFLFFNLISEKTKNLNLSLWSSVFLFISPLFLFNLKDSSWGSLLSFLLIVGFYLAKNLNINRKTFYLLSVIMIVIFLTISVATATTFAKANVDFQRNIASKVIPHKLSKIFVNKYTEGFHITSGKLLSHIDFGNYFFAGHPRQRWGVAEAQKLLPVELLLLILGIIKSKKKDNFGYIALFLLYVSFLTAFSLDSPTWAMPLLFLFSFIVAKGFLSLPRSVQIIFLIIFLFDVSNILLA